MGLAKAKEGAVTFNDFCTQIGLTDARQEFWYYVRKDRGIGGDADREEWGQLLRDFEKLQNAVTALEEA